MKRDAKDFLRSLLDTPSASGFEQPVQDLVRQRVKDHCDEVRTDVNGNVIASLNSQAPFRLMLDGHADEIGLLISHIDEKGFLYFRSLGGVNAALTQGERVTVHSDSGDVPGVIGAKPIHLIDPGMRGKPEKLEKQWIDIGAKDRKDAEKAVSIGDSVTFNTRMVELRNGLATSRAMDNRVGVFCVVEALRAVEGKEVQVALHVVSSVQEELGLRGAKLSAFGIDPHAGIAVDVGFASDYPDIDKKMVGETECGKGPCLTRGPSFSRRFCRLIEDVAKKKRLPYQVQAEAPRGGTDGHAIQLNRAGVAAALLSIPNRYMHSPAEICALDDLDNAVKLLAAVIQEMKPDMDFTP